MPFLATKFGAPTELVGEFYAIEVDALSFERAAIALSELATYVDNVEVPLRGAQRIAREEMKERFETETSPDGTKWFALDPDYAARKARDFGFEHPILTGKTRELKNKATDAAAWSVTGESIWFSTSGLPEYWAVHQFGSSGFGVKFVQIEKESVLLRTSPEGDQNIPPRPFIGISADGEAEILELFDIWFSNGIADATSHFMISSVGTLHARTPLGRIGERIHF